MTWGSLSVSCETCTSPARLARFRVYVFAFVLREPPFSVSAWRITFTYIPRCGNIVLSACLAAGETGVLKRGVFAEAVGTLALKVH